MSVTRRLAELEVRHSELDLVVRTALAEKLGIEVEMKVLRAGVADIGDLANYPKRTDAILAVLRSSPMNLTPSEVTARLNSGGRTHDDLKVVSTTMSYLYQQRRVEKVDGTYVAV